MCVNSWQQDGTNSESGWGQFKECDRYQVQHGLCPCALKHTVVTLVFDQPPASLCPAQGQVLWLANILSAPWDHGSQTRCSLPTLPSCPGATQRGSHSSSLARGHDSLLRDVSPLRPVSRAAQDLGTAVCPERECFPTGSRSSFQWLGVQPLLAAELRDSDPAARTQVLVLSGPSSQPPVSIETCSCKGGLMFFSSQISKHKMKAHILGKYTSQGNICSHQQSF